MGGRYAATVAVNGTGDVWAMNPLVTQMPGSGRYDAQGIELDFNNNNDHRGDDDGGAGSTTNSLPDAFSRWAAFSHAEGGVPQASRRR